MQNYNQNFTTQTGSNTHYRFVPVNSNVSLLGTTVSYGIQGANTTNTVNAYNNSSYVSGNYNANVANVNTWSNHLNNVTPVVSAASHGQFGSGIYDVNAFSTKRNVLVQPTVDISETSSDIIVSAYVTNGSINNMNINVTQDSCTINGSVWTGNDSLILNRTIPLTTSVRAEACEASLQSGVLEIRLPKMENVLKSKALVVQDVNQIQNIQ